MPRRVIPNAAKMSLLLGHSQQNSTGPLITLQMLQRMACAGDSALRRLPFKLQIAMDHIHQIR